MKFSIGSLVTARNREWVILPGSTEDLLLVKPLGGTDQETTGILPVLEKVQPASFDLPSVKDLGDYHSARLLRDAVRFGFKASAGPFRSFGRIHVEPRPYQLAPLLLALKNDPVRILIADDVGIGKTVESLLIARELLDRGEVSRLAVLCPPHLAEQWQAEMADKFNIEAELVLAGTAAKLEKVCAIGQSLFEVYPFVVVSLDFIKSERRRTEFLRSCPELVIVDEAHTCAVGNEGVTQKHQRHKLLKGLSENTSRHLVLVTAVPHSGNESAFRSLLELLDPELTNLPDELAGPANEIFRRKLAQYFVQRRRGDIKKYLGTDTIFPERVPSETTYFLSADYKQFFDKVLTFITSSLPLSGISEYKRRFRWWSALALLRCMASSPAAAAATLRSRALTNESATEEELDNIGRETVFDLSGEDSATLPDITPGAEIDDDKDDNYTRRKLTELAAMAEALKGDKDVKLTSLVTELSSLLQEGYAPIVFCRFIETAEYVTTELHKRMPGTVTITAVTGILPHADRERRVQELGLHEKRILVCTDCLSEGINLQESFNAVIHYDLSWNPTRHEQREGRVDRFGQPNKTVKVITYYGVDNKIDGIVVDVLLKKHNTIRTSLGYSVPVPLDSNQIIEAVFEGLLLKEQAGKRMIEQLRLFDDYFAPRKEEFHKSWDIAADREKRSRTMFAQDALKIEEVAREIKAAQDSIGSPLEVENFVHTTLLLSGALVKKTDVYEVNTSECPRTVKDTVGGKGLLKLKFDKPVKEGTDYLHRTHAMVQSLASLVLESAFDPENNPVAKRAGVIRTAGVSRRTTLVLTRLRFNIIVLSSGRMNELHAEDSLSLAFYGSASNPEWLPADEVNKLFHLASDVNVPVDIASYELERILGDIDILMPELENCARRKASELYDAHTRVRISSGIKGVRYKVEPVLPVDILGVFMYLPVIKT